MREIRDTLSETGTEVDVSTIWKLPQISLDKKWSLLQNRGVIFLGLSMFKTCKYSVAIRKC